MVRRPRRACVLLASPLALAASIANPAAAQEITAPAEVPVTDGEPDQSVELVVTGSRIRGVGPVGSAVVTVGRLDIKESGAQTTAQLLQQVPQIFNLGVSESSRGQSGGAGNTTFGSSVNIRGIGPYTTLTILNGHRTVSQGTSGFAVDPSIIPTLALERVEVVADGASAIYGSDAVAGVVNLILRRGFQGLQIGGTYGFAADYTERQIGAIAGHSWSTGQITVAGQYDDHDSLNARQRNYFRSDLRSRGGSDFRISQCNPGTITLGGINYAIPAGGVTAANRSALVANTTNLCDGVPDVDLMPSIRRYSASATFDQELTDKLSIYADGFATYREFRFREASTTTALTVPSTNAFFVTPPGLTPASEVVNYSFAGTLPQPIRQGSSTSYEGTIGARWKLPASWQIEGDFTYGYNEDVSTQLNVSVASALTSALASNNPLTAFNPFGGETNAAVISAITAGNNVSSGSSKFKFYQVSANGPLIQLPGGDVRAVVGYEGQHLTVDQNQIQGTLAAPVVVPGNPKHATRAVNSGFVELFVPLFGAGNATPGLEKLELSGAIRYDKYSDVGSTTNPKIGVNYSPFAGLTLRGSYGTSFRAPGIAQIYGNTNTLFIRSFPDPTIGNAVRQGVVRSGGNLNLSPETARTYSFGAEFQPSFAPRLRLSGNYFHVTYNNQVVQYLTDFTILQREAEFAGTGIITRNPSAALIAQNVAETQYTGLIPAGIALYVDGRSRNLGRTVASGIDFSANYSLPTSSAGTFALNVDGTYFTQYKVAVSGSSTLTDQLNVIFNPLRFKARGRISWTKGPLDAAANLYYNNGYRIISAVSPDVKGQALLDISFGIDMGEVSESAVTQGLTFGVNIRNLLDSDPPFVNLAPAATGGGGFDPTLASPVGRLVALSISKKF